jgi:outer membrane protein
VDLRVLFKSVSTLCLVLLTCASARAAEPVALTLSEAIHEALARNPVLAVEIARTRESESDYQAARATFLPRLSATAYDNRLNEDRLSPIGSSTPTTSLYTRESFAGLTARQLLYDGGRSRGARAAAALGLEGQRTELTAARDDTILRVTQAYARALAATELVRVARDAVARQQGFESMTADFFRAGKATRLDVLKAEAARLDAEKSLTAARESEAVSVAQFAQAVGFDSRAGIVPQGALARDLAEAPPPEQATDAALAHNPDLLRAAQQAEQARKNLDSARGVYRPELALQGSYGYRERDVGGSAPEWLVGVTANWTLYSGGALSAQVAKAQARLTQAQEVRRALELDIGTRVRDVLGAWRTALSDARAATQLVATDREALAAAETLYRAGKATALDVLTAQADLARAEGAQVTALANHASAQALFARVTGAALTETHP